ncbi:MAG: formyltransferase family protein [Bacteroidota bacterium]
MKNQPLSIYSCTLSPFGLAFLNAAVKHPQLEVREVVLASPKLWWQFHCRLKKLAGQPVPVKVQQRFRRQMATLEQTIAKYQARAELRVIDTVHQEEEYARLRQQAFALCGGFPELFQRPLLNAPQQGMVNFHPSYLPRCRGAHPIYWTIAKRESFGGISSHFMTTDIDAGPIIHREKIDFNAEEITYAELLKIVEQYLPQAITTTLAQLHAERTISVDQISEQPSYHRNDQEEDHRIDWQQDDFATVSAKIRAGNAFMQLGKGERLGLEPPLRKQDRVNTESGFQTMDGVKFSCGLLPFQFSLWERVLLRLLRSLPHKRQALLQQIGQQKLKAYYLRSNKSSSGAS